MRKHKQRFLQDIAGVTLNNLAAIYDNFIVRVKRSEVYKYNYIGIWSDTENRDYVYLLLQDRIKIKGDTNEIHK